MEEYGLIVPDFWDGITFGATAAWEWITGYPEVVNADRSRRIAGDNALPSNNRFLDGRH
jgi:hypothetical protein